MLWVLQNKKGHYCVWFWVQVLHGVWDLVNGKEQGNNYSWFRARVYAV